MVHVRARALRFGLLGGMAVGSLGACSSKSSSHETGSATDGGAQDGASVDGSKAPGTDGSAQVDSATPTGEGGLDSGPADTAPPPPNVVQHHNDGYRDGRYVDDMLTQSTAAGMHLALGFAPSLPGPIRAQPLWVENGPGGDEAFIVATEQNHVTAVSGSGSVVWDKSFGPPVPLNSLPCGNIDPLGITGTPYLDTTARVIYFDAMTSPDNNQTLHHMVYALSLDDGSTKSGWPVDVGAIVSSFNSPNQNQRGALQLLNGTLYIPYGGHDGDCDPYYGWVVGVPVANPSSLTGWHTMAARGGIWGPGSLPTDGTSLFPVTGNTEGTSTWGGGEAVLRLASGPTFSGASSDYYTPSNWQDLDNSDADLGGANDVLLDMPGAPVPHLVVAPGKDGNLYLINRDNLGGIGAELSKTPIANGNLNGAAATYTTAMGTYVALHAANSGVNGVNCPNGNGGNLIVVKISATNPPQATIAWCTQEADLGSPMVTSTDGMSNTIVWDADSYSSTNTNGPYSLFGYDADTGNKVFDGSGTNLAMPMAYFNTPIDTKGRIVVAGDNYPNQGMGTLYVFSP